MDDCGSAFRIEPVRYIEVRHSDDGNDRNRMKNHERTAMMADKQAIIAQYAEKYGLTDEMIKHAERWTETTVDLAGLSEARLQGILDMRFSAIAVDTPRSELWHTP